MTATQLLLASDSHSNNQLFSDYYLNEILPARADWKDLLPAAQRAMKEIATIFNQFTPSGIEAQTEDDLVKPVLRALGHTFEVQPALATPDGTKKPDYVLYRDEAGLKASKGKVLTEDLVFTSAFAVADAKYWDRSLDVALKKKGGDPFNNRNPSFQISFYMQHSGLPWGILTNGRLWRLYHRDTAHKLDRFYEVDLENLVHSGDPTKFLYFYAFFRREAFEPGPIGVQEILLQSIDYALKVGDQLKNQVFDALRHLAQGLLDFPQNKLTPDDATLKAIYDNSLILLYRLLFVSYAEARGLLPLNESLDYRDSYSLRSITREIASAEQRGRRLLPSSGTRWPRLLTLFAAIDKGSPPLKVATFNGGLFDPEKHPFLEQYVVGDRHLDQAIDILARVDGKFVDFRDLAEQHLGAIYEGLLEYHIVAIEPDDGWTVDLVNDRGERKKIGSYYTPNYIVKYIVDHTVGPVLRAAIEEKTDEEKIGAILSLNVVDPAMGSGYFLVEATEYIARFIVNLALPQPGGEGEEESDLAYWKRQVVQSCIYGVDINPLAVELAKLSLWLSTIANDRPLSFLDHHLRTGNSLIGTRITGDPDSKRQIAAAKKAKRKADKAAAVGQLSMMETEAFRQSMSIAVDSMWLVEHSKSTTVEDVKTQERLYTELHEALTKKYGRFADLVTATNFGLAIDTSDWPTLTDYALGRALLTPPSFQRWLDEAESIAERERFFHWDLEFPEVFYDRYGRPLRNEAGFHALVSNPPYVRQERLAATKPYLKTSYQSFSSVADLYIYFFERGLQLLNDDGRLGFISSGTFARANFAKAFRSYFPTAAQVEQVIDFGENQPFQGAEMVRPSIMVLRKGCGSTPFSSLFIGGRIPPSLDEALNRDGLQEEQKSLLRPEWTFQAPSTSRLSDRIMTAGRVLGELVEGRIFRGILTGRNAAFEVSSAVKDALIDADPRSAEIIKPYVAGEALRPWYQESDERWLIFTRQGIDIEEFPAIKKHLEKFRPILEPRPNDWSGDGKWNGRKPGNYRWFEIQDTIDYFQEFEKPKIVWPDISKLPRSSWEESGKYLNNTGYLISGAEMWLLALLQSRTIWFAISQFTQPLRERAGLWQYRLFRQFMERIPIPDISETDRNCLANLATQLTEQARLRNAVDQSGRRRILSDLGGDTTKLNQKLTAWWALDFSSFRHEVQRALKQDIPVRERDEWAWWLDERKGEHWHLTSEIVRLETELNAIVYALFDLSPREIAIVEETTKYQYGEV